jgi:hypothetical protein
MQMIHAILCINQLEVQLTANVKLILIGGEVRDVLLRVLFLYRKRGLAW